ncbi:hypothetical protein Tco_0367356 [Tanacetum coccineum]
MAKQCTARKRVKDSEWFKDKMLLTQAQEAGVVLDEEQQGFLADSLEETDDCEDLQLQATTNFKAGHVDTYDSDCDNEATTNAIFMANLSPDGSLKDDTVAPHYDSDTLFEVPHYDIYHDSDVLNSNIQVLGYIENIVSTNESYDELKGNSDVISYTDYMLTIGDDANNYVPPPVQKDDMMLFVIEQMKFQVEKCTKVNQESKSEIESLTSELERYKNRVRILGYAVKDGHPEQEAYLSRELYTVINDRIRKKHIPVSVYDSEETLILAGESWLEMLENKPLNLNKAQDLLTKFDECIMRRTTLYPHEIGSWEQSDIKGAFKKDVIPFSENLKETFKLFEKGFIAEVKEMKDIFKQIEDEVDQCSVAKKSFEIEKKQLLINNDRIIEENIANLQESNKSLSELRKLFAKLKEYNITLDIAFQNHKEQLILNNPDTKNKQLLVKTINNQSVEIDDLKVQVQDKIQKIEDENVSLAFQVSSLVKEREHIKLEYKKLYDSIKQI